MLHIRKGDRPNHERAESMLRESIGKGIKISKNVGLIERAYTAKYEELARDLRVGYGIDNVNSSKQVTSYLTRLLRSMPNGEELISACTEKGKLTFNKNTLRFLWEQEGLEVCKLITQARRTQRFAGTVKTYKDLANSDAKGCVYPKISKGKTNRFNYTDPALMNIAKEMLWYIVEPRKEGNKLYSIDIKFQEPYTLVHILGIKSLLEIMKEEPDFYRAVYLVVFGEECTSELHRSEIKTAWNAMSYGAFRETIVKYCENIDGGKVFDYFDSIPEYKQYKQDKLDRAKKKLLNDYTYFGTEVSAGELHEFKRFGRQQTNRLGRILMDIPIQGTGSDILAFLLEQLNDMNDDLGTEGLIELYYTRHDELILEVDKSLDCNRIEELLEDYFTHQVDDWLPFKVDVNCLSSGNLEDYVNSILEGEEEEGVVGMYY